LIKNTGVAIGNLERHIQPVWRFSKRNILNSGYSTRDRGYTLDDLVSGMVHTRGESPQGGLGDVQTCGMTLASAYMLCCLSAI